jgi:hypothetical protein
MRSSIMSIVLMADVGWKLAITVGLIIGGIILNALKEMQEARARKRKFEARDPKDRLGESLDPASELERYARETARQSSSKPPAATQAAKPRRTPATRSGQPQRPAAGSPGKTTASETEQPHRAQVSRRHLVRSIESRRAEAVHSELEEKHLVSEVSTRTVVGDDLAVEPPEPLQGPRSRLPSPFVGLLGQGESLTRVFVLSQIFGPPPGLSR